jgi:hypothetical protein
MPASLTIEENRTPIESPTSYKYVKTVAKMKETTHPDARYTIWQIGIIVCSNVI